MFPYGRQPYGNPPAASPEQFARSHPSASPSGVVPQFAAASHSLPLSGHGYPYAYQDVAAFKETPLAPITREFAPSTTTSVYQSPGFPGYPPVTSSLSVREPTFLAQPVSSSSLWPAATSTNFASAQASLMQHITPIVPLPDNDPPMMSTRSAHDETASMGLSNNAPGLPMPPVTNACLTDDLDFNFELPRNDERADPPGRMSEQIAMPSILRENPSDSESDVSMPPQIMQGTASQPPSPLQMEPLRNTGDVGDPGSGSSRSSSACSSLASHEGARNEAQKSSELNSTLSKYLQNETSLRENLARTLQAGRYENTSSPGSSQSSEPTDRVPRSPPTASGDKGSHPGGPPSAGSAASDQHAHGDLPSPHSSSGKRAEADSRPILSPCSSLPSLEDNQEENGSPNSPIRSVSAGSSYHSDRLSPKTASSTVVREKTQEGTGIRELNSPISDGIAHDEKLSEVDSMSPAGSSGVTPEMPTPLDSADGKAPSPQDASSGQSEPCTPPPATPPGVQRLSVLAAIALKKASGSDSADSKEDCQSAVLPIHFPDAPTRDPETPGSSQATQIQSKVNSGWMIIDSIRIPYIMHNGKPFVPVRIVEKQLLSCYPSKYPDELRGKPPLPSRFLMTHEAEQLTQMCATSTESPYTFTNKDLLVEYSEFNQFYSVIKKHFPLIKPTGPTGPKTDSFKDGTVQGGWLQINNTVIPYILRARQKFVPLQVLKFAAGLNTDSGVIEIHATQGECDHLNASCKKAGLKFNFTLLETRLASLLAVRQLCIQTKTKMSMLELPSENPLSFARYNTNLTANQQNAMGRMVGPRGFRMPMPAGRGMLPGMNARGGYRYPMQGRFPYQVPVRKINSIQGQSSVNQSDVCVLHHVQRVEFKGKIVTCLVRESDKEKFALVEAVSKLYFPEWELYDFRNALCNALRIPIYELTNEEEQAFISSYGLPIKHLNCKLAVRLRELDRFMPQLRYIFEEKKQMAAARQLSPGKRPGGQMIGGSPFKRPVPRGYIVRPGQAVPGRGTMMYRHPVPANGRMGTPINNAVQTVNRPPRRRPKHDNVVITID